MHHNLLQDLAIVLLVAGVVSVLFRRLHQPVVLGYILAGLIIGPHTPPFPLIQDEATIQTLAELGVILLMFSLGLHFSLGRLATVGNTAAVAALFEILFMFGLGYGIGRMFGWGAMDCVFLGAILSISSTTIIIKALEDLGKLKERFAEIIFGILIIEDLAAVAILALLSGVGQTGELQTAEVMNTLLQLGLFLTSVVIGGLLLIPPLLRYIDRLESREMLLVAALGLCFGVALIALQLGYSVALGAFLIGTIIGETRQQGKIAELVEPVRDMFSAVFFVAIGMLIQPELVIQYAGPILLITLAVVVGKVFTCALGAFVGGNSIQTSLQVGMGLAQIGEFSFIIATLGLSMGVISEFLYPITVAVSAINTLLTPYLIRSSPHLAVFAERMLPAALGNSIAVYRQSERTGAGLSIETERLRKIVRASLIQIALNLALVSALFISAGAIESYVAGRLPHLPQWVGGVNTVLWSATTFLCLPLFVALFRKTQALCMIFAETATNDAYERGVIARKGTLRQALTRMLLTVFTAIFGAYVLILSATLLPPLPILLVLLGVIALIVGRLYHQFVLVYAKAQTAIRDVLHTDFAAEAEEGPGPLLLREAEVVTLEIPKDGTAAGQQIRELEVRSKTGASIVGIERDEAPLINPSPHEELKAGDQVMLIGNPEQIAKARDLLGEIRAAAEAAKAE